jgi:Sulfotransferase domain
VFIGLDGRFVVALRIIGAGLGRTGTTSLKLALEDLLGEPCYHMSEVGDRPQDPDVWGDAYEGRLPDWSTLFSGYGATVDWPAAPFWRELSVAFPEAPIVLSIRDEDTWWESASKTIFPALATYFAPDAPADGWTRMGRGMMRSLTPEWQDEAAAKAAYRAYNEDVRRTAPEHRLVEWHPEDGWEPICGALGGPVPDRPFPHANTTADAQHELGLDP